MTIQVTSTTDSQETLLAVMGQEKPVGEKSEAKSAPGADESAPEQKETAAKSDTAEPEEREAEDDKEAGEPESYEDEDKSAAEKDKPAKKGKGGFQRRIDKLNAAKAEAQREAEYWKRKALEGAGETRKEPVDTSKPTAQDAEPKPEDFENHSDYVKALARFEYKQARKEDEAKEHKSKLESEHQTALKAHFDRIKSFKEKTSDYDVVMEAAEDVPVSAVVQQAIVESENGPELAYALAKDTVELERINALSPAAAFRALGAFEARIAASKASEAQKPEIKKTTKAPKPPSPVGSSGAGTTSKSIYDAASMTQKEYEAARTKQRSA